MKRRPGPTQCLEETPSSKTIRLGGRFINMTRLSEYGFDHGYLSYILSGQRTPSIPYATRVAKCLGILDDEGLPDVTTLLKLIKERNELEKAELRRKLS